MVDTVTCVSGSHILANWIAALGAYIANALVTYYTGNLTPEDLDTIESNLSSNHTGILMATIYLTYATSAMVFLHPYVKKLLNFCSDDCRIVTKGAYIVLTSCVIFIAGVLGAITAKDLFRLTAGDADSELPQDLINKVNHLKAALVALVVFHLLSAASTLVLIVYIIYHIFCTESKSPVTQQADLEL